MITESSGEFLLRLARKAIEEFVKHKGNPYIPKECPADLRALGGVFVTIYKKIPGTDARELRGCIGHPFKDKPLIEACLRAAIGAAQDRRFPQLQADEMPVVEIEISILTEPQEIDAKNPREYLKKIVIGEDGLIIKKGVFSGLLLPQVPVEQKWSTEEFLENLCLKAGLQPNAWQDLSAKIYKFQTQVFRE